MSITQVLSLLCGVALFLFGMTLMGDGLKKVSGSQLEPILYRLSGTPLRGALLGTAVTAVLQSSCATSVMTVGFVNSGMMKLRQAIGVILGSILGTAITGWIICLGYVEGAAGVGELLSAKTITGVAAVAGILLRTVGKKPSRKHLGDILMGFAVLMLGMSTMSGSAESLGSQPWFTSMLSAMKNPLMGILVGALFTALLQSASASVGILQALSAAGTMTFEATFPMLLGAAFGASAPVLLSALGANTEGKRAALIYPIASALGVAVCAALYYIVEAVVALPIVTLVMDPFSIAGVNTILRLVLLLLLLPFVNAIAAAVTRLVPDGKEVTDATAPHLEDRFLEHPALALEQCRLAVSAMAEASRDAVEIASALFETFRAADVDRVRELEEAVDRYEDALGTYLVKFAGRALTERQNREVSEYLHSLTDLERISDHALNIAESAEELHNKQLHFSEEAQKEIAVLTAAVREVMQRTADALIASDKEAARRVEPLEEVVDGLCDAIRARHVKRLQQGQCTIPLGFVLNDLLTDMERVSDHCSNLAIAVLEADENAYRPHEYTLSLREKRTDEFREAYKHYAETYSIG